MDAIHVRERHYEGKCGMKIIVSEEWLDSIEKMLPEAEREGFGRKYTKWSASGGKVKIDVSKWPEDALASLYAFLDEKAEAGEKFSGSAKLSRGLVRQWQEIRKNPDGQVVTKLENLESALKEFVRKSEHRYLFEQRPDGNMVPWFVEEVKYHEPTEFTSANVTVSLAALNSGYTRGRRRSGDDGKSFRIIPENFRRKTASQILAEKGYYLETPERMESYAKETDKYLLYCSKDGFQMSVTGKCFLMGGWHDSEFRNVEKAGKSAKMVVDPPDNERENSSVECKFWDDKPEDHLWVLPVHPVLELFDLEEHADYRAHVNNVEPYVYDTKVGNKLVLPPDVKDFIETLVEYSSNKFVDIVGGKEGGTVILLEGPPGTGKTLSAEVYAEVMKRPLYKVQSSQLGISSKSLEDVLKEVLRRSERWGAILLIDEADVYIHARGDDIEQNAVVGVFLRVLEYYRGVLFLTTNRGTTVDDAIVSRVTARFRYKHPTPEEQIKLWRVLADQNGIELSDTEIKLIVAKHKDMSGRDIKNLLKLAYVAGMKRGTGVTAGLVDYVSRFKQSEDA